MKKSFIAGLILLILPFVASAQEPTTRWPYLFPEFREGLVEATGGAARAQQLNVHLRYGRLHFLDAEGLIREAAMEEVVGVQIGDDRFLQVQGEMMRVVAQSAHGCVVEEVLGDFAALTETGGAYGSSSQTSATRKLSSVEQASTISQNHMLLMQSRSDGQMIGLLKTYYLVYPGHVVKANRAAVENDLTEGRVAEWKAWIKTHKIKWNRPESLVALLEFLNP